MNAPIFCKVEGVGALTVLTDSWTIWLLTITSPWRLLSHAIVSNPIVSG
jgi:hypothetical protein